MGKTAAPQLTGMKQWLAMNKWFFRQPATKRKALQASLKFQEPYQEDPAVKECRKHRCAYKSSLPMCPICMEEINARDKTRRHR